MLQELLEAWLFFRADIFLFHKLKFFCVAWNESPIQYDFHAKGRQVDIPRFDQRVQKRSAVLNRDVKGIRVQELEDAYAHRFIALAAEARYRTEPTFTLQFFFGDFLYHVQKLLRDQALQLTKGLLLKDGADLFFFSRHTLAQNQLPDFFEQWFGRFL